MPNESYEWDEAKRRSNLTKHRIDFEAIYNFDWRTSVRYYDDRHYEPRWKAVGFIGVVLHSVIYTERGDSVRIISIRKSSPTEIREYAQT